MEPLFLGHHPAVDFLNSALVPQGQPIETIGDGRAYLGWLVGAGLLDPATASRLPRRWGKEATDGAAAEARRVREWAREWLSRWRKAPHADYRAELAILNELVARVPLVREVVREGKVLRMVERPRLDAPTSLIGLVGAAVAALLTQEEPGLLKSCAGAGCTLWFLDRTRAHRRVYCSTAVCANRAKVSAFRQRQRKG